MTALALSISDGLRFELGRAVVGIVCAAVVFVVVGLTALGLALWERRRWRRNRRAP